MSEQTDFLKNVRDNFTTVQHKAAARLESLGGDVRKIFADVVEKGKASQKDLTDAIGTSVKPAAEAAIKRAAEAQVKARSYVDHASREQAGVFAGSLRKVAARLDEIAHKPTHATSN